VLGYARTPVGSLGKSLARVPAHELGATAARAALDRAGLTAADPKEWIIGCVGATGNDAYISRRVSIEAGAPVESTAMTVNRLCGSAMQAIALAAELMVGESDLVVAGGVENMSAQPFLDFSARSGATLGDRTVMDGTTAMVTDPFSRQQMGITAENVAARFGVSRQVQDEFAAERGLAPVAELVDFTKVGIAPHIMGYAPKPAIEKILARNALSASDVGWIELNEAFAAQAVPVIRDLGLDPSTVNPLGGAIAWGHPVGATGAIITARAIENIVKNDLTYGLASMCIGGGQAVASLWQAL